MGLGGAAESAREMMTYPPTWHFLVLPRGLSAVFLPLRPKSPTDQVQLEPFRVWMLRGVPAKGDHDDGQDFILIT